ALQGWMLPKRSAFAIRVRPAITDRRRAAEHIHERRERLLAARKRELETRVLERIVRHTIEAMREVIADLHPGEPPRPPARAHVHLVANVDRQPPDRERVLHLEQAIVWTAQLRRVHMDNVRELVGRGLVLLGCEAKPQVAIERDARIGDRAPRSLWR